MDEVRELFEKLKKAEGLGPDARLSGFVKTILLFVEEGEKTETFAATCIDETADPGMLKSGMIKNIPYVFKIIDNKTVKGHA